MLVREGWIRHKHGLASVKIALSQAPGHVGWAPGSTHLYMRIRHGSRSVRGLIWHQGTGGRGGGKAPEGPLGPPLGPQGDLGRAQGRGPGTALAACMQRLSSFRLFPTPFARFTRCRCAAKGDFGHPWIPLGPRALLIYWGPDGPLKPMLRGWDVRSTIYICSTTALEAR